jgi:translation initiation factor IF-1
MQKKNNSFNKNKKRTGAPRVFVDPNSDAQKQRRIDEGVKRGRVIEALPNAMFKVNYEDGTSGIAMIGGKLKVFKIRILVGDMVEAVIDPYSKKGRITKRG